MFEVADIKVYGAPWCPDCKRSKKFLAEHRVDFVQLVPTMMQRMLRLIES